jgi:hypothetical protein
VVDADGGAHSLGGDPDTKTKRGTGRGVTAFGDRVGDTMAQVLIQQARATVCKARVAAAT